MSERILAIDTATEACSVALWDQGKRFSYYEVCPREHTQKILPAIDSLLSQARITLAQLDAIAFTQGPGSFTGIRITLGIAQGLSFGAQLPLIGISTLQTMAQGAYRLMGATQVLTAIDARMSEVYWAAYEKQGDIWVARQPEVVIAPDVALSQMATLQGNWVTAGSAWPVYPHLQQNTCLSLTASSITLPHAIDMLPIAIAAWQRGDTITAAQAQAIYLRNDVAWKKVNEQ